MPVIEDIIIRIRAIARGVAEQFSNVAKRVRALNKEISAMGIVPAGASIDAVKASLTNFGYTLSRNLELYRAGKAGTVSLENALRDVQSRYDSWRGVMHMSLAEMRNWDASGFRLQSRLGRLAWWLRMSTHGMHGFRMEMLSVMFFGLGMERMFMGWLRPIMEAYGAFELFEDVLLEVFEPIMEVVFPIIEWLAESFMSMPDWAKLFVGGLAVAGVMIGGFLYLLGSMALGLGGVILAFSKAGAEFTFFGLKVGKGQRLISVFFGKMKDMMIGGFRVIGRAARFLFLNPIGLAILGVIAAVLLLNYIWKHNLFGIRQSFGNFLKWFSGIYDRWIKPVLFIIGSGMIILYNIIKFAITNAGLIWEKTWLTMFLVAHSIWNGILAGVEWFVNTLLTPLQLLWDTIAGIAGFLGYKLPSIKFRIDLSGYRTDMTEMVDRLAEVDTQLSYNFRNAMQEAGESVIWWGETLNSVTPLLTEMGNEFIRQGDRIDAGLEEGKGFIEEFAGAIGNLLPTTQHTFDGMNQNVTNFNSVVTDFSSNTVDNFAAVSGSIENINDSLIDTKNNFGVAQDQAISYINTLNSIPRSVETHVDIYKHVHTVYTGWPSIFAGYSAASPFEYFQRGGIVRRPTAAILGERGPEAVIPLDKLGVGQTINISPTIYITVEGVTPEEVVDKIKSEISAKIIEELNSMFRR